MEARLAGTSRNTVRIGRSEVHGTDNYTLTLAADDRPVRSCNPWTALCRSPVIDCKGQPRARAAIDATALAAEICGQRRWDLHLIGTQSLPLCPATSTSSGTTRPSPGPSLHGLGLLRALRTRGKPGNRRRSLRPCPRVSTRGAMSPPRRRGNGSTMQLRGSSPTYGAASPPAPQRGRPSDIRQRLALPGSCSQL